MSRPKSTLHYNSALEPRSAAFAAFPGALLAHPSAITRLLSSRAVISRRGYRSMLGCLRSVGLWRWSEVRKREKSALTVKPFHAACRLVSCSDERWIPNAEGSFCPDVPLSIACDPRCSACLGPLPGKLP